MEFHIITLFPEMFDSPFRGGMVGRAIEQGVIVVKAHPLRPYGLGKYRQVDDQPYGGGSGMVMRPEPIAAAIDAVDAQHPGLWRILMTPQGEVFDKTIFEDFLTKLETKPNDIFGTLPVHYDNVGHWVQPDDAKHTVDVLLDFK